MGLIYLCDWYALIGYCSSFKGHGAWYSPMEGVMSAMEWDLFAAQFACKGTILPNPNCPSLSVFITQAHGSWPNQMAPTWMLSSLMDTQLFALVTHSWQFRVFTVDRSSLVSEVVLVLPYSDLPQHLMHWYTQCNWINGNGSTLVDSYVAN